MTYEHRDYLGGIRTEIDSVWLSQPRAVARRKEINSDPVAYPGMVADTQEFPIHDYALMVPAQPQGRAGRPKLTAEQAVEIRERYAAGESLKAIGRAYNVTHQTVSDIVNRTTWRHV
ncbi:MAG TPA: helix-turn-helix domain-containing protein [Streptosporangiaceae bacterium]